MGSGSTPIIALSPLEGEVVSVISLLSFLFSNFQAEVAAEFINERVPGVEVIAHNCKIQEKDEDFYRQFHVVICGLDSKVARRWINGMVLSLIEYDDEGEFEPLQLV